MTDRLSSYLGYSAGIHVALILGAALFLQRGAGQSSPIYHIDFVGSTTLVRSPGADAGLKAQPAPATAPTAPAEDFSTARKRSGPLPKPSLMRDFRQDVAPRPGAEAKAETSSSGAPGSSGVAMDMPNFPHPWYISLVRTGLWSQWSKNMPRQAGEAVVVFTLLPNGRMVDLRIESSSGDQGFDLTALASARDAAPFPPLPRGFTEPFLTIHVTLTSQR